MTVISTETADTRQRIAIAQIDAAFRAVPVGVSAAALAAIALTQNLRLFGYANGWTGFLWALYIVGCAVAHLLLWTAYRRKQPIGAGSSAWVLRFSIISLAEGIGWGWATIGLAAGGRFDVELIFSRSALPPE